MAITLTAAARNAMLDQLTTLINVGSPFGKLKIRDSGNVVLATIPFADPAAPAAAAGVLTFTVPMEDTAADATGTAANAIITDANDLTIISGLTVATSGANINLVTLSIVATQPVRITSMTITAGNP